MTTTARTGPTKERERATTHERDNRCPRDLVKWMEAKIEALARAKATKVAPEKETT